MRQIDIREQCESVEIRIELEPNPTLDNYFLKTIEHISSFMTSGKKITYAIKKEYRDFKDKLFRAHKIGEVSGNTYSQINRRLSKLDVKFL